MHGSSDRMNLKVVLQWRLIRLVSFHSQNGAVYRTEGS